MPNRVFEDSGEDEYPSRLAVSWPRWLGHMLKLHLEISAQEEDEPQVLKAGSGTE